MRDKLLAKIKELKDRIDAVPCLPGDDEPPDPAIASKQDEHLCALYSKLKAWEDEIRAGEYDYSLPHSIQEALNSGDGSYRP